MTSHGWKSSFLITIYDLYINNSCYPLTGPRNGWKVIKVNHLCWPLKKVAILHTHITHIRDVHNIAGLLVTYYYACPKGGLIHRDRVMQLMKQVLYLQATTAGFKTNIFVNQKKTATLRLDLDLMQSQTDYLCFDGCCYLLTLSLVPLLWVGITLAILHWSGIFLLS